MYFNKCHQPENFAFPEPGGARPGRWTIGRRGVRFRWAHLGEDVYRFTAASPRWPAQHSTAELDPDAFAGAGSPGCRFDPDAGLHLADPRGRTLLTSEPGRVFGVSGQAWLMQLAYDPSMRFYGLGAKSLGFEHTGRHTKFWNTDVWADFDMHQVAGGRPDPMYLSIPYLIIKRGNRYAGVLIHNPYAVFVSTNPRVRIAEQSDADADADEDRPRLFFGAPDGWPEVYFIVGPTLDALTRKLQRLVGTTPAPPLWALGHHQCRWGYASHADLDALDRHFRRHRIPTDGLWLDIDYMRGYRVFTWDKRHWPDPDRQLADLHARGRRVIPILDPGVKADPKYDVYRSAQAAGVLCRNPAGGEFVGFVWPGTTVFPDFSLEQGRRWWADWVRRAVAGRGVQGAWLDMNDPSTGLSENSEMLFDRGRLPHAAYHNQYALGMARATHAGFLDAHPDRRPFLLTRSGFTSIGRYAAAWTGDNVSNAHHLRLAIPATLNLALSGLPFNGPDVPGFGGDATAELAIAWYKAGFLFPFLRNHAICGTRRQEPWAFGPDTTRVLGHYIRLRYKLLPYLYNLFARHEATGEAILRPLLHDFADSRALPLDRIDDQFMVGPAIMQAPVLDPGAKGRRVVLPRGRWFDAAAGRWTRGGRTARVRTDDPTTPIYLHDGSLIPMRPGDPADNRTDLRDIELHVLLSPSFTGRAELVYHADDGESFAYRRGGRTTVRFEARRTRSGLTLRAAAEAQGFGPLRVRVVLYGRDRRVTLRAGRTRRELPTQPHTWTLCGRPLRCRITPALTVGTTSDAPIPAAG